jgi:hypothetical protein
VEFEGRAGAGVDVEVEEGVRAWLAGEGAVAVVDEVFAPSVV